MYTSEASTPMAGVFTVFIALDQPDLPLASGRILCGYLQEAVPFSGLSELLLKIDGLCDTFNLPQSVLTHRQFYPDSPIAQAPTPATARKPIPRQTPQQLAAQFGRGPVFGLQILYRQHASWQGHLWSARREQTPTIAFRSALELLHLLHDALSLREEPLPSAPVQTR